jgi:hypothetical protein
MRSTSRDTTDLLRTGGALLLTAGATTLFIRKGLQHAWGEVALLLVVLVPMLLLYRLALRGGGKATTGATASRAVMMIAAILLSPLTIAQFLGVLGAGGTPLEIALVFGLTSLFGALGARQARVPYAALLASLAALVTWLIVWGQILDHPKASAFRGVLLLGGGVLMLAALGLARRGAIGAREVGTVSGLALVLAGAIGIFVNASGAVSDPVTAVLIGWRHNMKGGQGVGWDLFLLVASAALIWTGARVRLRGMGYVGGFGIVMFVLNVGFQFDRIYTDKAPTASLAGWPLALLILGALGLIAAAMRGSET